MANIIILKVGNGLYIDFGVYASSELKSPQGFNVNTMVTVRPTPNANEVQVLVQGRDAQMWNVSHVATPGCMIIDLIDGVAPTSQADLIKKLTALM